MVVLYVTEETIYSLGISLGSTVPASNLIYYLFLLFSHMLSYMAGFSVLLQELCGARMLLAKDCLEFHPR